MNTQKNSMGNFATTSPAPAEQSQTLVGKGKKKDKVINPDSIAGRIVALRKRRGWTQAELAEELAVNTSVVNRIERGMREPTVLQVIVLVSIFDTTCDYILLGRGPVTNSISLTKEEEDAFLSVSQKIRACRFGKKTCQLG